MVRKLTAVSSFCPWFARRSHVVAIDGCSRKQQSTGS